MTHIADVPIGQTVPELQPKDPPKDWEWAFLEVFGHRRHAGRCREEERFGAKMLRIDVPNKGNPDANGWTTHWYGGSSIFSYTLTDEASVMAENKGYEAPSRYHLLIEDQTDRGGEEDDDLPL